MREGSYRPSNGTEGMWFMEKYCMQCLHCDPDPEGESQCDILCRSLLFYPNQKGYPTEWRYVNGEPKCTNWQKWDWGNDGDPDDPENPKAPFPDDPAQLVMPFDLVDLFNGLEGVVITPRVITSEEVLESLI